MKASEAKAIALQKAITLEDVLINIKKQAENGSTTMRYFDLPIDYSTITKLLELGYTIEQSKGPVGDKIISISWA